MLQPEIELTFTGFCKMFYILAESTQNQTLTTENTMNHFESCYVIISAEKLSGWSNPGWLTPVDRHWQPSLARSNRNHQQGKLRVMKTALNMQKLQHVQQANVAFPFHNAAEMQITRAGICAAAAPLQLPGRTAATRARSVFTAWEECLHSHLWQRFQNNNT